MPSQEDLKRKIQTRMNKMGESYAVARKQVLGRKSVTPPREKFAELAGIADSTALKRSGRDWAGWVDVLDRKNAFEKSHQEIAALILKNWDVSPWWAQSIAVGYERIRGLRAVGQRRTTKKFEVSKSKTFPVDVETLYKAFKGKRARNRWLPNIDWHVRVDHPSKSMRITWPDSTSLHVYFTAKGPEKSSVAVQHVDLTSDQDRQRQREFWTERLKALNQYLIEQNG